jgi:hypothetical protein
VAAVAVFAGGSYFRGMPQLITLSSPIPYALARAAELSGDPQLAAAAGTHVEAAVAALSGLSGPVCDG